jgi:hypothetical protein
MSVVFGVVFWLLLVVLALAVLALITPVLVSAHLSGGPRFTYFIEVRLVGWQGPQLFSRHGPRDSTLAAHKTKLSKPKQRKTLRPKRGQLALLRALPLLIKDVLRQIHLEELKIDLDYGLGDPADTGILSGMLMPLHHACQLPASISLKLRPDFTQSCLRGSLTTALRVRLAAFLLPALRFVWRAYGPSQ